ncbi:MAG TPA: outer membrane lipoprotein carrier protein LolA [Chthoniobacterales bacterium]|nr:outer membrane lipoprotein carrier protein LolA [Chthoniobacterales bacterium]
MRFALLVWLLFTASLIQAQSLSQADVKNLFGRIRERRASAPDVRADFQEQRTIHLLNKPIVSSGKLWFHPPNKFRREVGGNSPSVTVSNGHDLWIYYPNFKSVEDYSLGKRSPVDAIIAAINTALNLEDVESTFQISGTKVGNAYELRLLPRSPSMKRMFQRFDLKLNSDFVVERTDMVQPGGDQIVTTYSDQTRAPIPESTFEFTPPAGTQVTSPLGR